MLTLLLICSAFVTANAVTVEDNSTGANFYNHNKYSTMIYNGNDLGFTYTPSQTTFKVWSPEATKVEVKLYKTGTDRENGAGVIGTYPLTKGSQGVWSTVLKGDYKNVYYTYLVTAKNTNGTVVTNETQDIYSKAVGCNGDRSMVVDLDSTDPEGWDQDQHVFQTNMTKSAIWELHIRDFSCDPNSGISAENQGKYLAFTEGGTKLKTGTSSSDISTGIDYLVEQGINTVQLMPFADYDQVDEINGASADRRNWGYNPKNYNVPDGSYSNNPYDGNVRINEVKQMVQALHDRGIAVVMDVVYNHTAGYEASCFTKTVPGYYYRMYSATQYQDGSGQGCELATENAMTRNFIVQSLRYWADEYHIDGFRFDLMGCMDTDTLNAARTELNKISTKILMYGEPWAGGSSLANPACVPGNASKLMTGVGMFASDTFVKALSGVKDKNTASAAGWIGGNTAGTATVVNGIKGNYVNNSGAVATNDNTKTVNFLECHDNLALWDKITGGYTTSGEGKKTVSQNPNKNSTSAAHLGQLKLAGMINITSQGYSFLQLGTEFARTKNGQANSYNSPDSINQLDWSRVPTYNNVVKYYRGLNQIKDVYTPFSDDTSTSKNTMQFISQSGNVIAYTISNNTAYKANEWGKVAVLMNSGASATTVSVPGSWVVVANENEAGVKQLGTASGSYQLPARSGAILVEASSFKDFSANYKYGTLTTNHYVNGTLAKTTTAKYKVGHKYHAHTDEALLKTNNVSKTEGTPSGTFSGDTTVSYYYESNGKTVGKLNVNYVDGSGKTLTPSMSYDLEAGSQYSIPVCSVEGYQLNTDKYPASTTGTFSGANQSITFTYKPLDSQVVTVHYYNSSNFSPVYCYAYTDDGEEPLGAWNTAKNSPAIMKADTARGSKWFTIDIPIASCKVMFHGNTNQGQEPGQNEPGYAVAGDCIVQNKVVTYNSTLITSFIDIATGKKLKADVSKTENKKNTDPYTTTGDNSLGTLVMTPANASGFCAPGVTNVVYLYNTGSEPNTTAPPATTAPPTTAAPPATTAPQSTSADKILLGDADCNGKVDISDVTAIQKHLASISFLSADGQLCANVDGDNRVSIKDASYIQRYLLGITVPYTINQYVNKVVPTNPVVQPTTGAPTNPIYTEPPVIVDDPTDPVYTEPDPPTPEYQTVLFSNAKKWDGTIYCYHWSDGESPQWPGDEMEFVGTNDYGESQYSIEIPVGCYVIFTNGTLQTDDTIFNGETGFYPTDEINEDNGHYISGSWQ